MILCIVSFQFIFDTYNQYIEARIEQEDAPITIYNFFEESVSINCYEKRMETSPSRMVPLFDDVLVYQTEIQVEYGKSLFEEMLFCIFITSRRKWNCGEELIMEQCMWEDPRSIMMRGGLRTDDDCPLCDQKNSHGEISCQWAILHDGIYLKQYSPILRSSNYFQKNTWIDHDPERKNLAAKEHMYQFSIHNDIDNVVKITCSNKLNNPMYLHARSNGDHSAIWHKQLNIFEDRNLGDTWVCDILVVETGTHCDGVRIWTPPGEIHPDLQDPPCIDCAWKLTNNNILLDMRNCTHDSPIWEPMHNWIQNDGID